MPSHHSNRVSFAGRGLRLLFVATFLASSLLVGLPVAPALAGSADQVGQLYCNFGAYGVGRGSVGANDHSIPAIAVYPSTAGALAGKIVVAGRYAEDAVVMRFNTDGSLDTSFSGDGLATTHIYGTDYIRAVGLDSSNRVVIAGNGFDGNQRLIVARFTSDGALDTSFSGDGLFSADITTDGGNCGGDCQHYYDLAIQSDDRIVVVGDTGINRESVIVRLTTGGALDGAFDSDGKKPFYVGASAGNSYAKAVQIDDSSGSIFILGGDKSGAVYTSYLVKLTSAGAFDSGFDGDGKKWLTVASDTTYPSDLLLLSGAKIAALATSKEGGAQRMQSTILQMDSSGAFDTSFGGDGIVALHLFKDLSDDNDSRFALQPDGKFLITSDTASGKKGYLALARLNTDGSLDADFGSGGIRRLSLPHLALNGSRNLALLNDGHLAVLGELTDSDGKTKVALLKLFTSPQPMSFGFALAMQATSPVPRGFQRDALDLLVCMNGAQSPLQASSFSFNTSGTTSVADLDSAALFHTTGGVFFPTDQVGASIASPSGALDFVQDVTLAAEFNHFWLAYSLSPAATIDHQIDGQALALTVDGLARTPVITSPTGSRPIFDLFSPKVIWTDNRWSGTTRRIDPDGSHYGSLLDTLASGYWQTGAAIDMADQRLYFVNSDNSILRTTLDGAMASEILFLADIFNPQTLASGLAVDPLNAWLFYTTDAGGGSIFRANLDGSGPTAIATGQDTVPSMAVDATHGRLYWIRLNYSTGDGSLRSANLDGSAATTLDTFSGTYPSALTLDVDDNKVYYADGWGYSIKRCNLDGSNKTDLIAGFSDATGPLAIDTAGDILYWLGWDNGNLYKAPVASPGSVTTLVSDVGGSAMVFKPLQSAPSVDTPTSADVTADSATLGGNLSATGRMNVTERGVYWSTSDGFTPPGQGTKVSASGDWGSTGAFTIDVSGLPAATPIYFKAFAANPGGVGYSAQASFTTLSNSCNAVGSGTVPWTEAFAACPPGAKLVIPPGLTVNKTNPTDTVEITFIANTYQVTFDGAAPQVLGGSHTTEFYNWVIVPSAGVFLATTPEVADTLFNNGTLSQTLSVGPNASRSFLQISGDTYRGVDIATDSPNNLGQVTVAVDGNASACTSDPTSPAYRNRCIRVSVENSGMAGLTLHTTAAEDDVDSDSAYQYYPVFGLWADVGTSACSAPDGAPCQAEGVELEAGRNDFLIGGEDSPTAVVLRDFKAGAPILPAWLKWTLAGLAVAGVLASLLIRRLLPVVAGPKAG